MPLTTCTVTIAADARPTHLNTATMTVVADRPVYYDGTPVYQTPQPFDPAGTALPHVNQAGLVDSNGDPVTEFAYIVTGELAFSTKTGEFSTIFQVFTGQTTFELSLLREPDVAEGVAASAAQAAASATSAAASAASATAIVTADLDTANATLINATSSATKTALTASIDAQAAPRIGLRFPPFESVPVFICGDSYGSGGSGTDADAGTTYFDRWASRNRTQTPVNRSVAGTRSDQILMAQVIPYWTPNTRGVFAVADLILNDCNQDGAGASTATAAAVARTVWAYATARYVTSSINDTGLRFGPDWTDGTTSTAGSYADVSFDGDSCFILTTAVTGSGGTLLVKNTSATTVATITTGGFAQTFTQATKISGFGSGPHTVRVSLSTGSATLVGMALPSPTPPVCPWVKPGSRDYGTSNDTLISSYLAAVQTVANEFPAVVPVEMDADYNKTTMLGPTHHPNDYGNAYIADRIEEALRNTAFGQGLNRLTVSTAAAAYTATAPAYTSPGATAPAAPTGVTVTAANQLVVSWTRGNDGGATVTAQELQVSSDGSSWTTISTSLSPTISTYTIASGVTQGTAYYARVRAVNSVGSGSYGTSAGTATAGAAPTVYWSDDFEVDGALTTTQVGSLTYTHRAATFTKSAGKATVTTSTTTPNDLVVDSAQANGTLTAVVGSVVTQGLVFRSNSAGTSALVFGRQSDNSYKLLRRTAANSYTTLNTVAGVTPASGDTLKVILNGTAVKCYVNGSLVVDTTEATVASTNTIHGLWVTTQTTGSFNSASHNSLTS